MEQEYFNIVKEEAKKTYKATEKIFCPYFDSEIILNSDGLHHLQFSARRERNKKEQLLKFRLLPGAFKIIEKSGTLQEYRETLQPFGKKTKDGLAVSKKVCFWAFIAIVGREKKIKIKTVLRRVGDGNIIFWSVMPYPKLKNGQKFFTGDIEDE